MNIKQVTTKDDLRQFYHISEKVYQGNIFFRSTEDEIIHMLVEEGPSAFHNHASVAPYLILQNGVTAGRFTFIFDNNLPDYIQVSFFEALPGLPNLTEIILRKAKELYPKCRRIVFGLNGHLNYGAGFLASRFDEAPVFGLPYTPEYYLDYFKELQTRNMISYRFPVAPFVEYRKKMQSNRSHQSITVRKMNKKKLHREIEIYTYLNNACFTEHPYWADRDVEEDFQLFYPFRFLIKEENLLFAEKDGNAIGFFLWYPDFNQLVKAHQHLGLRHVIHFYLNNPINTFRFTEIAVLPKHQISHAVQAMILYAIPFIQKSGYTYGEGGFIFEENKSSIAMTRRFLERATGVKMEPYRRYAVFETKL